MERNFSSKFLKRLTNHADKIEPKSPGGATALRVTADLLKGKSKREAVELLQNLLGGDPTTPELDGVADDYHGVVWGVQTVCNAASTPIEIAGSMAHNLLERLRRGEDITEILD